MTNSDTLETLYNESKRKNERLHMNLVDVSCKIANLEKENAELKEKLDILIDEYVAMRSYGGCSKFTRQDCIEWLNNKSAK